MVGERGQNLGAGRAGFLAAAQTLARQEQIYLNVAVHVYLPTAPYGRDETHFLAPDGAILWTYQKSHPIPGLETYTPGDGKVPVADTPYATKDTTVDHDPWIVDVPIHGTTTLYRLTGDLFAWLCLGGTIALIAAGIGLRPKAFRTARADGRVPSRDHGVHGSE
ncbi:hypothetical protein [Nocardia sp. NPDC057030]|uniref:hypothetical protein n=1 Tax=unclassified Nocardia TaxID=2637762 RepID=UPI00363C061A